MFGFIKIHSPGTYVHSLSKYSKLIWKIIECNAAFWRIVRLTLFSLQFDFVSITVNVNVWFSEFNTHNTMKQCRVIEIDNKKRLTNFQCVNTCNVNMHQHAENVNGKYRNNTFELGFSLWLYERYATMIWLFCIFAVIL